MAQTTGDNTMTIEQLHDLVSDIQERNETNLARLDTRINKLSNENRVASDNIHSLIATLTVRVSNLEKLAS